MATTKVTAKPPRRERMALTLSDPLRVALYDLSEALEKPAATIATELLTTLIPHLEGLAKMARAAKVGDEAAVKRALVHMVGDNMAQMIQMSRPEMVPKGRK